MDRPPIVAGKFYPGLKTQWEPMVRGYLGPDRPERPAILAMVPHAGYVYSGAIAGETLAGLSLPATVLLLGPNHTGQGAPLSLWPSGRWLLPGAHLDVDEDLAGMILAQVPSIQANHQAHVHEHSLEVILPFLWAKAPDTKIVPLAVALHDQKGLLATAHALAETLKKWARPVMLVVSSDMSHFLSAEEAKNRDALALKAILDMDPEGLLATVASRKITMCGVLPMTMGLAAALELGATSARLVRYGTSGDKTGDSAQVVGYAGVVAV